MKELSPNRRLRAVRLANHWTMQKAADQAGVSLEAYSRWEYGRQKPRLSSLQLLCDGFGKSAAELGYEDLTSLLSEEDAGTDGGDEVLLSEERENLPSAGGESLLIRLTPEEVAVLLPLLEKSTIMDEAKRYTLKRLVTLAKLAMAAPLIMTIDPEPMERLTQAATTTLAVMNAHSFTYFQSLLDGCWGLNNSGEMDSAKEALSSFLPKMIRLAPDSPKAAALAAQGLRLESLLSAHQLRIHEMVPLCQQSVEYARNANDPDVLSAALNGLAVAYKYTQQLEASFKTYQEALFCSDQASPLLRTRVYAGAAAAFAQRGRLKEADFYIHLAYDDFPEEPEHDPNFLSADNGLYMVAYYEGLIYLQQGMPKQAIEAFERYKTLLRGKPIPERNRLEIVNHQGQAAILSGNQEYYAQLLEEGITGALALGSKKRYDEAVQIFQQETPRTWWRDRRLQQVIERFSLPLGER